MTKPTKELKFYLVDVCSAIPVDGELIALNFCNTHFSPETALEEAKRLSKDPNVIKVSVHTWIKDANGEEYHAEGVKDTTYYYYHRDGKKEGK